MRHANKKLISIIDFMLQNIFVQRKTLYRKSTFHEMFVVKAQEFGKVIGEPIVGFKYG